MATGRVPTTANSPLTAKGDLFGYSTTQARVPVGNNGETLVADSSATTGLRWQGNYAAGKNAIINGDFRIWQRGTSFTSATGYTADRWTANAAYPTTISQQSFTPGAAPVAGYESPFFIRLVSVSAQLPLIQHKIEDVRTFAGQTVTLSFWAKADASTTFTTYFDQNFGSGGSATVGNLNINSPTLTTSWVRYSTTFTLPSISGKTIGTSSFLMLTAYGTANRTVDIWGVQLEAGNTATAFQTATGTLAGELDACKRYAQNINYSLSGKNAYNTVANGSATGATSSRITLYLPVPMRVAPTSVTFTASGFVLDNVASAPTVTGVTINQGGTDTVLLTVDASAGALTNKDPVVMYANNNSSANLILSAEL